MSALTFTVQAARTFAELASGALVAVAAAPLRGGRVLDVRGLNSTAPAEDARRLAAGRGTTEQPREGTS